MKKNGRWHQMLLNNLPLVPVGVGGKKPTEKDLDQIIASIGKECFYTLWGAWCGQEGSKLFAKYLGWSPKELSEWRRTGKLPGFRTGGRP